MSFSIQINNIPCSPTIPTLHEAIKENNIELVKMIISQETINQKDKDGITPLMVACITQSFEIVSMLCQGPININDRCYNKGYTAFMYACFGRNLDILKLLISKNCSLSTIDNNEEDICCLGLWNPILSLINEAKEAKDAKDAKSNTLVICNQCKKQFQGLNDWNPEGQICSNCTDTDIFGSSKHTVNSDELKKVKKQRIGNKSASPILFNNLQQNLSNKSFYMCPSCKKQADTSLPFCSCGKKSPLFR